jgi:hypothetical protein
MLASFKHPIFWGAMSNNYWLTEDQTTLKPRYFV